MNNVVMNSNSAFLDLLLNNLFDGLNYYKSLNENTEENTEKPSISDVPATVEPTEECTCEDCCCCDDVNLRQLISKVVFKNPHVVVFWIDGTITRVKCTEGDTYDPEKGLALAIVKYMFGNSYFRDITKLIKKFGVDYTIAVRKSTKTTNSATKAKTAAKKTTTAKKKTTTSNTSTTKKKSTTKKTTTKKTTD